VRNASIVLPFLFLILIFVYILYLSFDSLFLFRYFFILCPLSFVSPYVPLVSIRHDATLPSPILFSLTFAILTSVTTLRHIFHFRLRSTISLFSYLHQKSTPSWLSITRMPQHAQNNVHTYPPTLVLDFFPSRALIAAPRHSVHSQFPLPPRSSF